MFSTSLYIDMCTYIIQDILRWIELQDILRLIELQVAIFCTAQMCCRRFALIVILRLSIKLKFESENGVHFQLARINHRIFGGPRLGQTGTERNREGLRKFHGSIWEGEEAESMIISPSLCKSIRFISASQVFSDKSNLDEHFMDASRVTKYLAVMFVVE